MRTTLLPLLCCPSCKGELSFTAFSKPDISENIADGIFICRPCQTAYPLVSYVPRFLPDAFSRHKIFIKQHEEAIVRSGAHINTQTISALKKDTIKNFGSEWETWNKFGWGEGQTPEGAKRHFDYKVLFTPEEIKGKRVLDAGCGNGRYSKIALDYGAEVISVDLSHAVDAAEKNLHENQKAHIVQADLFTLPFKEGSFDFIFSNGVLMHTGNAKRAFLSLIPLLTKHGKITIHLYHKGNIIYETVDATIRAITTRLPLPLMYHLSKLGAHIASLIPHTFLHKVINAFVRFEAHPHYIFDWYTAPIATHHTYTEVYKWLEEAQLYLHHDHNATNYPFVRKWISPFLFMTVKAGKQSIKEPKHTTT